MRQGRNTSHSQTTNASLEVCLSTNAVAFQLKLPIDKHLIITKIALPTQATAKAVAEIDSNIAGIKFQQNCRDVFLFLRFQRFDDISGFTGVEAHKPIL